VPESVAQLPQQHGALLSGVTFARVSVSDPRILGKIGRGHGGAQTRNVVASA
jgi:hypothetical protein